MPLIDLKTSFKSLKYGHDRIGGGNSGQPYIQTDINVDNKTVRAGDDGLIRGGTVGSLKSSKIDTLRIGKFFTSFPQGPLFITKQIGLQLSNPRLETKQITIGKGKGILGFINNVANNLNSTLGPTRIYNLGINTLAQIPVNALGKHFNRHGLTLVQDDQTKYLAVAEFNNKDNYLTTNRLIKLKDKLINQPKSKTFDLLNTLLSGVENVSGFKNPLKSSKDKQFIIDDYIGGPSSVYGIGRTTIRRYDFTGVKGENKTSLPTINYRTTLGLSNLYFSATQKETYPQPPPFYSRKGLVFPSLPWFHLPQPEINKYNNIDTTDPIQKPTQIDQNVIDYKSPNIPSNAVKRYKELREAVDKLNKPSSKIIPFSTVPNANFESTGFGPFKYKEFETGLENIELQRNPSSPFKYYGKATPSNDGSQLTYNNTDTYSRIDSDILTNVFTIINPFAAKEHKIFLSSYMKGFKDDFNATWNEINYAGRAESFYVYNKFKRSVSFNLQIPCFNRKELFEKHRALGQLASTTSGAYNDGFLGGVLIKLNIGNYIVGEYSILNSLTYSIPDDTSWDITPEGRLAMLVDASFSFTIIHKELPQYKQHQGFFKYLPDQVSGYLQKGNRTPNEQAKINNKFNYNYYKKDEYQNTIIPSAVIINNIARAVGVTNTTGQLSTTPLIPLPQ